MTNNPILEKMRDIETEKEAEDFFDTEIKPLIEAFTLLMFEKKLEPSISLGRNYLEIPYWSDIASIHMIKDLGDDAPKWSDPGYSQTVQKYIDQIDGLDVYENGENAYGYSWGAWVTSGTYC